MENKNITSLKSFSKNNKINIITSFPKSGSTWMRFIIYDLFFNNDNIKVENSNCVKNKIPDFHNLKLLNEKNFDDFLKGRYIFFKTHFSYEQMKMLSINKIIILIRNPIDIFISLLTNPSTVLFLEIFFANILSPLAPLLSAIPSIVT